MIRTVTEDDGTRAVWISPPARRCFFPGDLTGLAEEIRHLQTAP